MQYTATTLLASIFHALRMTVWQVCSLSAFLLTCLTFCLGPGQLPEHKYCTQQELRWRARSLIFSHCSPADVGSEDVTSGDDQWSPVAAFNDCSSWCPAGRSHGMTLRATQKLAVWSRLLLCCLSCAKNGSFETRASWAFHLSAVWPACLLFLSTVFVYRFCLLFGASCRCNF